MKITVTEKQIKTLQSKLSKIEKKEAKKPKEDQLFNDCVATLMTLGYKSKRVAKNDVSDFLVRYVDEFDGIPDELKEKDTKQLILKFGEQNENNK